MAVVRYTARRSLIVTVSVGELVTHTLPVKYAGLMPQRAAQSTVRESMAGKREAYYYRGRQSYVLAFIPVDADGADRLRMFLASVEDGQEFEFAPDGTDATPSPEYRTVVVDPPNFSETPHPERQDYTTFSAVTIVEVG